MAEIEFFFDCSSPWTYMAFENIQPMAAETGATIRWRPILVGGIFNTVNPSVYASRENGVPAKQAYMVKSMRDWARASGLTIKFPPTVFPVNSVKVMRGCLAVEPQGKLVPFARAAFHAYFTDDIDVSQDDGVREVCRRADVDADALFEAIAQPAIKDQLRVNTEEAIRRGAFGSPTMFVNGDDMYFGNDTLPLVKAAVQQAGK